MLCWSLVGVTSVTGVLGELLLIRYGDIEGYIVAPLESAMGKSGINMFGYLKFS